MRNQPGAVHFQLLPSCSCRVFEEVSINDILYTSPVTEQEANALVGTAGAVLVRCVLSLG